MCFNKWLLKKCCIYKLFVNFIMSSNFIYIYVYIIYILLLVLILDIYVYIIYVYIYMCVSMYVYIYVCVYLHICFFLFFLQRQQSILVTTANQKRSPHPSLVRVFLLFFFSCKPTLILCKRGDVWLRPIIIEIHNL